MSGGGEGCKLCNCLHALLFWERHSVGLQVPAETGILKDGRKILAFVFDIMPGNAQRVGDIKNDVEVEMKGWDPIRWALIYRSTDESKIVNPLKHTHYAF